jgi:hypothetical protein
MLRTLATSAVLVAVAAARADVPPPAGQVRVPLGHIIEADKAYPEYVFVVVVGSDPELSYKAELSKDKPLRIEGKNRGGRGRLCWLAAVPADTARQYRSDKELVAAVIENKAWAALTTKRMSFDSFTVVPEPNAPKLFEQRHRIERMTAGEGIVLTDEKLTPADPDPHAFDEESAVRWGVAGVVAAVAVCGLGLWLLGRRRGPGVYSARSVSNDEPEA